MKTLWRELFHSPTSSAPLTPAAVKELAAAVHRVEARQQTQGHHRILSLIAQKLREPKSSKPDETE